MKDTERSKYIDKMFSYAYCPLIMAVIGWKCLICNKKFHLRRLCNGEYRVSNVLLVEENH